MYLSKSPFVPFNDLSGNSLANGYLYYGQSNQNPETNPITVYWDAAGTIPATQPIRTLAGYPARSGSPALVYVSGNYSLTVKQSNGVLVYTVPSTDEFNILALLAGNTGSDQIGHFADGAGAQLITLHDLIELDSVSMFKYMTEVQRNDVIGGTFSVNVSSPIQKVIDHATTTQRIVRGYGIPRLEDKIYLNTSFISDAGGMFEGQGTVFKWFGSGDRVFELPAYVQGWIFERFRVDCSNVTSDTIMIYGSQGLRECTMRNVEGKGYYNAGTYANHDFMKIIGGSGATKYDMSQNTFEQISLLRCRNGIEVTDPSSQGPGNGNKIDGLIALCNGPVVKLPGSANKFINNEVYVDTGSGGHAYILDGQYAYGWSFDTCDFDGALGTAGWEPIHGNSAGSVSLASFDGGINSIRGGNKPDLVLDAGTGGKQKRYSVINMNNEDSTTFQVNAITTGQGIATNNRNTYDSNMVDYSGTATLTGSGAMTLSGVTLAPCQFEKTGKMMTIIAKAIFTIGGTPSSTVSLSLPTIPIGTNSAINSGAMPIWIFNNGAWSIGTASVTSGGNAINCFVNNSATPWTAGAGEIDINLNIPIL